jgi:hypothetical protein
MYYVDTGSNGFCPKDDYEDAEIAATAAMEGAFYFLRQRGWLPYWANKVEIRRGKSVDNMPHFRPGTFDDVIAETAQPLKKWITERNRLIKANAKLLIAEQKRAEQAAAQDADLALTKAVYYAHNPNYGSF